MQLNELIQRETIESISQKTNLAKEVIQKLVDRNCKALRKPQAMGAISIIEREYGIELNALREECHVFFSSIKPAKEDESEILQPIVKRKRSYVKPVSFLILAALTFGAWYFFGNYYEEKVKPTGTEGIKSLLGKLINKEVAVPEKNLSSAGKSTIKEVLDTKGSIDAEENASQSTVMDTTGKVETEENVSADLSAEADQSIGNTEKNSSGLEEKESSLQPTSEDEADKKALPKEQPSTHQERELITILPQAKMWFRLVDLDTKKARQFKRKDKYEVDLREHSWLFATEESNFSIIDKDIFEEYRTEGKLFLRFDQTGVHPLSEEEYRALVK